MASGSIDLSAGVVSGDETTPKPKQQSAPLQTPKQQNLDLSAGMVDLSAGMVDEPTPNGGIAMPPGIVDPSDVRRLAHEQTGQFDALLTQEKQRPTITMQEGIKKYGPGFDPSSIPERVTFDMSPEGTHSVAAQTKNELFLGTAQRFNRKTIDMDPSKNGAWDRAKIAARNPSEHIPFIAEAGVVTDLSNVFEVANKFNSGKELTPAENALLKAYATYYENSKNFHETVGGGAVDLAADLPKFMLEFATTGGLSKGIEMGALKGLEKYGEKIGLSALSRGAAGALAKYGVREGMEAAGDEAATIATRTALKGTAERVAGIGAGAAGRLAQAGALPTLEESLVQKQIPVLGLQKNGDDLALKLDAQGQDFWGALKRAYGEQAVMTLTARMGHGIDTAIEQRMKNNFLQRWMGEVGIQKFSQAQRVASKLGWDGIVGQMFEFQVQKPFMNILNDRPIESGFDIHSLATEALGMAMNGAAGSALSYGLGSVSGRNAMARELETQQKILNSATNIEYGTSWENTPPEKRMTLLYELSKTATPAQMEMYKAWAKNIEQPEGVLDSFRQLQEAHEGRANAALAEESAFADWITRRADTNRMVQKFEDRQQENANRPETTFEPIPVIKGAITTSSERQIMRQVESENEAWDVINRERAAEAAAKQKQQDDEQQKAQQLRQQQEEDDARAAESGLKITDRRTVTPEDVGLDTVSSDFHNIRQQLEEISENNLYESPEMMIRSLRDTKASGKPLADWQKKALDLWDQLEPTRQAETGQKGAQEPKVQVEDPFGEIPSAKEPEVDTNQTRLDELAKEEADLRKQKMAMSERDPEKPKINGRLTEIKKERKRIQSEIGAARAPQATTPNLTGAVQQEPQPAQVAAPAQVPDLSLVKRQTQLEKAADALEKSADKPENAPRAPEILATAKEARDRAKKLNEERKIVLVNHAAAQKDQPAEYPITGMVPMQRGREDVVTLPTGEKKKVFYAVASLNDLHFSHDPYTFEWNDDYQIRPAQPRDYKLNRQKQMSVEDIGNKPDVRILHSDDPSMNNGAPVVRVDGQAIVNGRLMGQSRAYDTGNGNIIHQDLEAAMKKFGIEGPVPPESERPVLIRVLSEPVTKATDLARLGIDSNEGSGFGYDEAEDSVRLASLIQPADMDWLADQLDEHPDRYDSKGKVIERGWSIRDLINKRGEAVKQIMLNRGLIPANKVTAYVDKSGDLNTKGRDTFESAILGQAIDDAQLLEKTPKSILNKLDRSLAVLARIKARNDTWDIMDYVKDAMRFHWMLESAAPEINSSRSRITTHYEDSKKSVPEMSDIDLYLNQDKYEGGNRNLLDVRERPHPITEALARMLELNSGEVKELLGEYVKAAPAPGERDQDGFSFAEPVKPVNVFNRTIGKAVGMKIDEADWGETKAKSQEPAVEQSPVVESPQETKPVVESETKSDLPEVDQNLPEKKVHEFGSTHVNLNDDAAAKVRELAAAIPDEDIAGKGRETDPHITIRYGLKDDSDLSKIEAVARIVAPFEVNLGKLETFPPSEYSEGAAVLKAPVEGDGIRILNRAVDKSGADFKPNTFSTYEPHVTIAYVKPEAVEKYVGNAELEGTPVQVDHITVSKKDGTQVQIPLTGKAEPKFPESYGKSPKTLTANDEGGANYTKEDLAKLKAGIPEPPAVEAKAEESVPEPPSDERVRRNAIGSSSLEDALSPKAQKELAKIFKSATRSRDLRHIREAMEVHELLGQDGSEEATAIADEVRDSLENYLVNKGDPDEVDAAAYRGLQHITGEEDPDPSELLENEVFASAQDAGKLIFDTLDPKTASFDTEEFNTAFGTVEFRREPGEVFPKPKKPVDYLPPTKKESMPKISIEEARAKIDEWKAAAKEAGKTGDNKRKIVYSLYDESGIISKPWEDAGYTVRRFDIQKGQDLTDFGMWMDQIEDDIAEGYEVEGVLAQPPCTSYTLSGVRWWPTQHDVPNREMVRKKYGETAAELFDKPLDYANTLVAIVKLFVGQADPKWYAMENPAYGRINTQNGLPKAVLGFNPSNFGDPYSKQTQLWGEFNADLPTANVEPTEGSKAHKLRGDVPEQKKERSRTPEGFAYSFFMANSGVAKEATSGKSNSTEGAKQEAVEVSPEVAAEAKAAYVGRDLAKHGQIKGIIEIKGEPYVAGSEKDGVRKMIRVFTPKEWGNKPFYSLDEKNQELRDGTTTDLYEGLQVSLKGKRYILGGREDRVLIKESDGLSDEDRAFIAGQAQDSDKRLKEAEDEEKQNKVETEHPERIAGDLYDENGQTDIATAKKHFSDILEKAKDVQAGKARIAFVRDQIEDAVGPQIFESLSKRITRDDSEDWLHLAESLKKDGYVKFYDRADIVDRAMGEKAIKNYIESNMNEHAPQTREERLEYVRKNPPHRMVFENAILTVDGEWGPMDLPGSWKGGKSGWGKFLYNAPLDEHDQVGTYPMPSPGMMETRGKRVEDFDQRQNLKDTLGKGNQRLVKLARKNNKGKFESELTESDAKLIKEKLGLSTGEFWQAVKGKRKVDFDAIEKNKSSIVPPPSDALPGFEGAVEEQKKAAGELKDEQQLDDMNQKLSTPKASVSKAAGEMERNSPLFGGTEASGNGLLFGGDGEAISKPPKDEFETDTLAPIPANHDGHIKGANIYGYKAPEGMPKDVAEILSSGPLTSDENTQDIHWMNRGADTGDRATENRERRKFHDPARELSETNIRAEIKNMDRRLGEGGGDQESLKERKEDLQKVLDWVQKQNEAVPLKQRMKELVEERTALDQKLKTKPVQKDLGEKLHYERLIAANQEQQEELMPGLKSEAIPEPPKAEENKPQPEEGKDNQELRDELESVEAQLEEAKSSGDTDGVKEAKLRIKEIKAELKDSKVPNWPQKYDFGDRVELEDGRTGIITGKWNKDGYKVRTLGPKGPENVITTEPKVKFIEKAPSDNQAEDVDKALEGISSSIQEPPALKPEAAYSLEEHKAFRQKLMHGDVTPAEVKANLARLIENKDSVIAEISKMTVPELRKRVGYYARNDMKKAQLVDQVFRSMMAQHMAGKTLSYSVTDFSKGAGERAELEAIHKGVDSLTPEEIKKYAEEVTANTEKFKRSVSDPQSLDEFRAYIRLRGEDKLTPEQRARYDELVADSGKSQREKQSEYKAVVPGVQLGDVELSYKEGKHTKTGEALHIVQLSDRVSPEKYKELLGKAKALGGWYSSFIKKDAGFTFKTKEAADKFMQVGRGESVSRADEIAEHKEEVKQSSAERMRSVADNLEAKATESLSRDRQDNTARRARMAASAEDSAQADLAMSKTLRNLADAIEEGKAKHLEGITAKTQVQTLNGILSRAKYDRDRAEGKNHEHTSSRPPDMGDVDHVVYSYPTLHTSQMLRWAADFDNKPGAKLLANRLRKLVSAYGDKEVYYFKSPSEIEIFKDTISKLPPREREASKWHYESYDRLQRAGITNLHELRAALREYLEYKGKKAEKDPLKEAMRALVGRKFKDWHSTQDQVLDRMLDEADIQPGMKVLEPSAGTGHIADAIKGSVDGVDLETVEPVGDFRKILEMKGHNLVGHDFMEHEGSYDRIVMNPPFSDRQDVEHVRHAYDLLKPGGRLVAIMGEGPFFGSDTKATNFRQWLDANGGWSEKLPEGSFKDSEQSTGVAARLVVIDKPHSEPMEVPSSPADMTPENFRKQIALRSGDRVADAAMSLATAHADYLGIPVEQWLKERIQRVELEQNPADGSLVQSTNLRNVAEYQGKKFWSGVINPVDGGIEEVHTYERAMAFDHHHGMYFTPEATQKINSGEWKFFFVGRDGSINGTDLTPEEKDGIREQVKIKPNSDDKLFQSDRDDTNRAEVERAGGEYLGTQDGLIWFNDPTTHSTLAMKDRPGVTAEDIEAHIEKSREAFRTGGSNLLKQDAISDKTGSVTRGAVEFMEDGRAVLYLTEHANESTIVHELGHIFRRSMKPEDLKTIEKELGIEKWDEKAEEKFARGLERYVWEGKSPSEKLAKVFDQFKTWMRRIYDKLTGSAIDVKLSDGARKLYAKILGAESERPIVHEDGGITAPPSLLEADVPERLAAEGGAQLSEAPERRWFDTVDDASRWAYVNKDKLDGVQIFEKGNRAYIDFDRKDGEKFDDEKRIILEQREGINADDLRRQISQIEKRMQSILPERERVALGRELQSLESQLEKLKTETPKLESPLTLPIDNKGVVKLWTPGSEVEPPVNQKKIILMPDEGYRKERPVEKVPDRGTIPPPPSAEDRLPEPNPFKKGQRVQTADGPGTVGTIWPNRRMTPVTLDSGESREYPHDELTRGNNAKAQHGETSRGKGREGTGRTSESTPRRGQPSADAGSPTVLRPDQGRSGPAGAKPKETETLSMPPADTDVEAKIQKAIKTAPPIKLADADKPVGKPVYSKEYWQERLKRFNLPENIPVPTRMLSEAVRQRLMPGQAEIVETALSSLDRYDSFLAAPSTGTGKTYIAAGIFAEEKPEYGLYLTTNRPLLMKTQKVFRDFGLELKELRPNERHPSEPGLYISTFDGAQGRTADESGPGIDNFKWNLVNVDEAGQARRWFVSDRGQFVKNITTNADKAVFMSATPFHTPLEVGYLEKLGLWKGVGFKEWGRQIGAVDKFGNLHGGPAPRALARLREQLIERGQMVNWDRDMTGFTGNFGIVPLSTEQRKQLANTYRAFEIAENYFTEQGKSRMVMAVRGNQATFIKSFLERARLPQAIELAKKLEAKGYKVAVFFETKKEFDELYDFLKPVDQGTGGMISKLLPKFPAADRTLVDALGADKVANYTGSYSGAREAEKDAFTDDTKRHIATTYAAGGIGVDFHDTEGDKPRAVIYLGLPWSGVAFDQALGRPWRFGTKSDVQAYFLSSDAEPEVRLITGKVAPRLESLHAGVSGINMEDDLVRKMQNVDQVLNYELGNEDNPHAGQFGQSVDTKNAISHWKDLVIPSAEEMKHKGMRVPGTAPRAESGPVRLFQSEGDTRVQASRETARVSDAVREAVENRPPSDRTNSKVADYVKKLMDESGVTDILRQQDKTENDALHQAVANLVTNDAAMLDGDATPVVANRWREAIDWIKESKGASALKMFDQMMLTSGRSLIRNVGGEAGHEIANEMIPEYHVRAGMYGGEWVTEMHDIRKKYDIDQDLSSGVAFMIENRSDDYIKAHLMMERGMTEDEAKGVLLKIKDNAKNVEGAAKELRELFRKVGQEARDKGVEVEVPIPGGTKYVPFPEEDPNYFPHIYSEDVYDRQSKRREKIITAMMKRHNITRVEAESRLFNSEAPNTPLAGNIERAREGDVPGYRTDLGATAMYLERAAEAIARTEVFGQRREKLYGMTAMMPDPESRRRVTEVMDGLLKRQRVHDEVNAITAAAADYTIFMKMAYSAIPNMSQFVNAGLRTNNRAVLMGLHQVMFHWNDEMREAMLNGSILEQMHADMMREFGINRSLSTKFLEKVGFVEADIFSRAVAGASAKAYMNSFALPALISEAKADKRSSDGDFYRRVLKDKFSVNDQAISKAIADGHWDVADLRRASKRISDDTQFTFDPTELPASWRAKGTKVSEQVGLSAVRIATMLKGYAFKQGVLLHDALISEAKKGNFRPWVPFLTMFPVTGTLIEVLENAIRFNKDYFVKLAQLGDENLKALAGKGDKLAAAWLDIKQIAGAIGHVGGLGLASMALESMSSGGKFLERLAGPVYSDMGRAVDSQKQAYKDAAQGKVGTAIRDSIYTPGKRTDHAVGGLVDWFNHAFVPAKSVVNIFKKPHGRRMVDDNGNPIGRNYEREPKNK